MYDLVDRRVDQLAAFERTTLAAIRRWVHAFSFAGDRAEVVADPFAAAMLLIDQGSTDDLPIGRPCQPIVGESEAVLIGLWRLVRAGEASAATALASLIVGQARAVPLVAAIDVSLTD